MKRVTTTFLAILLIGIGTTADLSAQSIPSPYRFVEKGQEAGLFAGYFNGGSDRFGLGPKTGTLFGARYSVRVSGALALEAVAGFSPTTRDVVNPTRAEGDRIIEEAESVITILEARIRIDLTGSRTWHGLQPFALIGVGASWDAAGQQSEDLRVSEEYRFDFGTQFSGSFGGGTRWMITDRFLLRVDLAAQLYKVDTPSGFRDVNLDLGAPVEESQWVTSPALTAGLSWRF